MGRSDLYLVDYLSVFRGKSGLSRALSLTAMLAVALTAIRLRRPMLMRSIKHFTA